VWPTKYKFVMSNESERNFGSRTSSFATAWTRECGHDGQGSADVPTSGHKRSDVDVVDGQQASWVGTRGVRSRTRVGQGWARAGD
jgi:hypothetical protein